MSPSDLDGTSPAAETAEVERAQRKPSKLAVRIGNQLLVYRSEDQYGPYCTAAIKSRKKRCSASLLYLDGGSGWEEVCIGGADGFVTVPITGDIDEECWIRQRCPKHLHDDRVAVAPEWTFFDLVRDAGLINRRWPVWTPLGVTGRRPTVHELYAGKVESFGERGLEPATDEQADLLVRAFAAEVEPDSATALYRFYDEKDRLLYIGITDDLLVRLKSHILASSWMDYAARAAIERCPTRKEAADAETAAIKAEQPLFNDIHNRTAEARARLVEFLIEHGRADLLAPYVSRG